ncbi:hypothetical protein VB773_13795 [Haloarculaceae archaeon H-GB2-1]|nr:hypothetical protein [Haloarculaceae archaeon H-GB2-1]
MTDARERELGTSPHFRDTDSDGFEDGIEADPPSSLPNLNPTRVDVAVEVDYMGAGCRLSDADVSRLQRRFANAPTSNPDGSEGISLHVVVDESVPETAETYYSSRAGNLNDVGDYAAEYFDHPEQGFHYALVVQDAKWDSGDLSEVWGVSSTWSNQMTVECNPNGATRGTFMHELGHSLGLSPRDHTGIDSSEVTFEEYPSTMNYNSPGDFDGYSDGYSDGSHGPNDFDDWGHVEQYMDTPSTWDLRLARNASEQSEGE